MKKFFVLLLGLSVLFEAAYGLTCQVDNLQKPGTCISKTFSFWGKDVYMGCYNDPYYEFSSTPWVGYTICYATIRYGNKVSDKGTPVADVWSTNRLRLTECLNYNGAACDVYPRDGFTLDPNAPDRGFCDASSGNCVKCNANHVEIKRWIGGPWIGATSNNLCESGCGADALCDEKAPNSWTNRNEGPFEVYCGQSCTITDKRCRADFGADQLCDYKRPGDVCAQDYCDEYHRLIDYNKDGVKNNIQCDSRCGCNTSSYSALCSSVCGADNECDKKPIGYNNGNSGCNSYCQWINCGLYAWNENSCYTSCESNNQCYLPAVCDLRGDNYGNCIIDNVSPVINLESPPLIWNPLRVSLRFSVDDNADAYVECNYTTDEGVNVLGELKSGENYEFPLPTSEGKHFVDLICADDSNNIAEEYREFYLDFHDPTYTNYGWSNVSPVYRDIINKTTIKIYAYWTDNFGINKTILYTNKTGVWAEESVLIFNGSPKETWSNFTLSLEGLENKEIGWKIKAIDPTERQTETTIQSVYVNAPSTNISIELNEIGGNYPGMLEFVANGQPTSNVSPIDTGRTNIVGDFKLISNAVGVKINNKFYLKDNLGPNFNIWISGVNDYSKAVKLTTTPQDIGYCNNMLPGDECQLWIWLDWNGEEKPGEILNSIKVESYENI